MRLGQVYHLRRPLSRVRRRNTNTPAIANTPSVAATLGRFLDEVWFRKKDATITEEFINTMLYVCTVSYAQTINRPRTKLIQWAWVERVLRRDARKVSGAR